MRLFYSVLLVLVLAGCASGSYKKLTLPNGKEGYRVSCLNSKQPCYDKSREACGGNYTIKTDTRINEFRSELLIECKK